ncbi:hypothetical protein AB0E55_41655, partial [Amycolatopsis keratiniphila]
MAGQPVTSTAGGPVQPGSGTSVAGENGRAPGVTQPAAGQPTTTTGPVAPKPGEPGAVGGQPSAGRPGEGAPPPSVPEADGPAPKAESPAPPSGPKTEPAPDPDPPKADESGPAKEQPWETRAASGDAGQRVRPDTEQPVVVENGRPAPVSG